MKQFFRSADGRVVALIGLWATWLSWVLTGPGLLETINWDQGAYIALAVAPVTVWSHGPWNAHFAIGHVYQLFVYLTQALGGTVIDGYRLGDSVAFGLAAAIIADMARRLSGDRWIGALLGIAWATAWVNLLFLFTLEDNVLYLPAAAGVFWLAVARRGRWTTRQSVWAGALAAWAWLQSWQALYYLGPAGLAALLFTRGGRREKVRQGVVVVGGFLAMASAFNLVLALTSHLKLLELFRSMFSRPTGSFNLSEPSLSFWNRITGLGAGWMMTHTFMGNPPLPVDVEKLGACVIIFFAAVLAVCTWLGRRAGRWDLFLLALTAFLLTLVTPLYHDYAEWRYLVRYDFWPMLLVPLGAALFGWAGRWRVARALGVALVSVLIVWNTARAVDWTYKLRRTHASLPDWTSLNHPDVAFYGRDGMPWFEFFRGVHRVAPHACRYVLALGEASEGWWNPDLMGSMFSELHGGPVILVGNPADRGRSRYYTPPIIPANDVVAKHLVGEGCEWVSRDASRLLGWRY